MEKANELKLKPLGIDTHHEHTIYMRDDCPVCISEGFNALTRLRVSYGSKTIIASLNVLVNDFLLASDEISLSENAIKVLGVKKGDLLTLSHIEPIDSMSAVRAKIYGQKLLANHFQEIVEDIVAGNYANVELAAFITACAGNNMTVNEIIYLSKAMITTGQKLNWPQKQVFDKHCVGGLPGNRTTPIVVAIVAAYGLTIPKTSSRAITSPAGTADTMESITIVNLSLSKIKEVVGQENGCIAWGGSVQLSPADDKLIRVEKALDIDSDGQLIASILSKKIAAGSTHVVIDIPVGSTAKVRTKQAAEELKRRMSLVADGLGLKIKVVITDGSQPVGRGIGPALEARDLLAVLKDAPHAPSDLKERSLHLAGELLELSEEVNAGSGYFKAREILESGAAYKKFVGICLAQGGFSEPSIGSFKQEIKADKSGIVTKIDNRRLAKIAKLAGAPENKGAGIDFFAPIGTDVKVGQILYAIHAESTGALEYALGYLDSQENILTIK